MPQLTSRLLHLITVLFGVSIIVFLLTSLLPTDPAAILAASAGDSSPQNVEAIRRDLGLDKPLIERYLLWVMSALSGNLGTSYFTGQSVAAAIGTAAPVTFQLIVMIQVITLLVAVPVALFVSPRRDSAIDRGVATVSFAAQAIPNFVVALVLILIFSVGLGVLPAIGYTSISEGLWPSIRSLIIPAIAMSFMLIPVYIRVLRSSMIQTLQQEFILVGRAIGLSRSTLLYRYALRPSLPTLVTVVGVNFGVLMGGTVVVEAISGLPGLGTLLLSAVTTRDYILVQGLVLVFAVVYVVVNFLVDIIQASIDPRVRVAK
ncbi:ABC transporter permease [Homoserinimonas hongtaonis]|uniref:Peptide ABC transporter n=1 Tax=Homoserinimonas hongtaonis TaxID=2079791 RepID=A0A2U1T2B7_9MICO|nr:ABC transporter permease [Salinibacterium hongtaonis]PWB98022.1 peptide ABC transporter [Salinibacterium hongtaonis]